MQEFFMDYGLWLLIALLVVIGVVFLLSGRKPSQDALPPVEQAPPPVALVETPVVDPAIAAAPPPPPVEPEATVAQAPEPAPLPVAPEPEPVAVEPIPASPAVAAPPATAPEAPVAPVAPATGGADDLLKLKGVGPKLNSLLIELGVTSFAQIAAWTDQDVAAIDARLGNFRGRPVRDQWIDQARYLAVGDIAGFEATYGKL